MVHETPDRSRLWRRHFSRPSIGPDPRSPQWRAVRRAKPVEGRPGTEACPRSHPALPLSRTASGEHDRRNDAPDALPGLTRLPDGPRRGRRYPRTYAPLVFSAVVVGALLAVADRPAPRLAWNVTPSVPTGLYYIGHREDPRIGDHVAIAPRDHLRRFLAGRGYLPQGVLLIKPVAALPGDVVCRRSGQVAINGKPVARARRADRNGRPLPTWQGCRRLGNGELFLLSTRSPASLDGRYFGPTLRSQVLGRAVLIWPSAPASETRERRPGLQDVGMSSPRNGVPG